MLQSLPAHRDISASSGSLIPCIAQGVASCSRGFSGEGLRACIYGVLLANDLIPSGASGAVLDVDGGFSTGLGYACFSSSTDILPKQD